MLVHGVLTGSRVVPGLTSFDARVLAALRAAGFDPRLPALPAVAPSTERAPYLARVIEELAKDAPGGKVYVIAHSQGGIDVRLLLTDPVARSHVAAVATLSAPHDGTPLAEVGERMYGSLVESLMNRAARRIAESRGWPGREGHARALIASLTPREMARLRGVPGDVGVPFFSIAATPEPARDGSCDGGWWTAPTVTTPRHFVLRVSAAILTDAIGAARANDGLVPTASQRYGIFLGCAPIDHLGWLDPPAQFDGAAFLAELARGLRDAAAEGEAGMRRHAAALARIAGGRVP